MSEVVQPAKKGAKKGQIYFPRPPSENRSAPFFLGLLALYYLFIAFHNDEGYMFFLLFH